MKIHGESASGPLIAADDCGAASNLENATGLENSFGGNELLRAGHPSMILAYSLGTIL
jgi:hypothetical protein